MQAHTPGPPVEQDTPVQDSSGMNFDAAPVKQDTPANQVQHAENKNFAPYDAKTFGKFTTPENYEKWASGPQPKAGPNSKPGEYEAWMSANTPGGMKQALW